MTTRVLLVDPDECIVEGFSKSLRQRGFEVVTASDERGCLRQLCESAPDVFVLEPDALRSWGRNLLTRQRNGNIPLVVVSRFSRNGDVTADTQWLIKPISTEELRDVVQQAADSRSTVR